MPYPSRPPLQTQYPQNFAEIHRPSISGPPFLNVFDGQINRDKLPRPQSKSEKKINFLPPFLALALGSTTFLIIMCIILVVPILELAMGLAYRTQCPINSNIPIYLIVAGACGIGAIGLMIVILISFACCIKQNSIAGSFVAACSLGFAWLTIGLLSFFLFVWFIVGNVWVFGARNNVTFDKEQSPNYCHPTLYQFAFWILIISYIMSIVACCAACCRACCQSCTSLKA